MDIKYNNQSQFELFPLASKNSPRSGKLPRLTKDLTLSFENIIVLCIIFLMSLVLFFSFGVERGKIFALESAVTQKAVIARDVQTSLPMKSIVRVPEKEQNEKTVVLSVAIPEPIEPESVPVATPPVNKVQELENIFTIQVASFKLEVNAQKEVARLKGKGHDDSFIVPKGGYSIVCVGKFGQKEAAKKYSSRLKNRYNDCLVRRL